MAAMELKDVGEFELIERMAAIFRQTARSGKDSAGILPPAIGIGDDAAVWRNTGGYTIATTDAMVEGIHFTPQTTPWYELGWKAMASNVSDVAGMGGIPRHALAVLAAPPTMEVEQALELCRGMADLAARFGTDVVGGDTVSSPVTMVTITVLGETLPGRADEGPPVLSRFHARPGDVVAVTGRLGSSAGGLELMLHGRTPVPERFAPLVEAHRLPLPRVREGQLLVEAGVRCGMDLSDGLVGDLTRICQASRVSVLVEVEKLPIDPLLREAFGDRAIDLALSGGEDYELLCTAPAEVLEKARLLLQSTGSDLTVVGRVREVDPSVPPVMLAEADGRVRAPGRSGWEHFALGGT